MTARTKRLTRYLLAAAVLTIAGGSASAAVRADNFNDNTRAPFWKVVKNSTTTVKERSSRLSFRSSSEGDGKRRAAYVSKNWTYSGDLTNKITFDYKLNVPGLTTVAEEAAIGVWTEEPDGASALEVVIIQSRDGWIIELELFVNGQSALRKTAPLNNGTGSVEIVYTPSNDKMRVKVNGQTKITVPNLNGDYGPFDLNLELFAWSIRTKFGYNNAWIDNFKLTGTIDG